MNSRILKPFLAAAGFALAIALPSAHAQLTLSGSSHGSFVDPGLLHTTVTNGPAISLFESGVPYRPAAPHFDTSTSIKFTGATFANVGNGDMLDLGLFNIKNGITLLGTTASSAAMDLYLDLPSKGITNFKLTTLLFTIDNTANNGISNVPDLFFIGHSAVNSLMVGGREITFDLQMTNPAFGIGDGSWIAENHSAIDGLFATIHFTPVPEASTFALWGATLLVGLLILRRTRQASAAA